MQANQYKNHKSQVKRHLYKHFSIKSENLLITSNAGKKIRIRRTEPNPTPKSSTEPEPKLIKYANGFKILVSKEPEPNPTRNEVFRVPKCIRN